ncbi:MAG: hypothetical protein KGM47_11730 [Acidobacteriota bacterium]|nr:hypothetical protein [Acidobacteriota bacterium]
MPVFARKKVWQGAAWPAFAMGMVLLCVSCNPASVAFRQGRKAEEQRDYDSAVIHFQQALKYQPENAHFQIWAKNTRYKASYAHTDRGMQLLRQGQLDAAAGEFQKAIGIDPSNQAAAQELQKILLKQSAAQEQRQHALRQAMERHDESQSIGVVKLKQLSTQSIAHLHISSTSQNVFETLGKLAGINVVFYNTFQSKQMSLDLTNVTILDALKAAADEAGVFWKPITPNTLLIVPDNITNRRLLEPKELKTIYLQNPVSQTSRTAIMTSVKQITASQQVFEDADANSITIYGTPEQVAEATELIHSLDRGKAEVLIDVTVLEADKDRLRDLGLAPVPLSSRGTMAAIGFNPAAITPPTTGGTAVPPNLPLNKLGRISTSDFSVELPGVIANALLTDSRTHILENPQVRVTAGEEATLHIGSRVPFATGSFGVPGAGVTPTGSTGFGLLANTQFQYQDVGVSLTITPFVAADGDVILTNKIEISAVGTPSNIGGLEEPTFTDRTIKHSIRLKEGEVSLLGGLIQSQTINSVSGIPGLADVPLLRYLFSTTTAETTEQEVLIMLTPHVIRLPNAGNASGADQAAEVLSAPASGSRPVVPQPHGVPQ